MMEHDYVCSNCGNPTARDMLTVKKTLFTGMGAGAKTTRARVIAWLCPSCTKLDPDWHRPAHHTPKYEGLAEAFGG
jgi:hypothetical protein